MARTYHNACDKHSYDVKSKLDKTVKMSYVDILNLIYVCSQRQNG